ncbi:MAG TPA: phosphoribosyltransferase family protein [Candidatus Paceibacterota bacterium]|nr:phosphoribosyltransferase family protein [Candidatus Paceibacterota bacterium]
MSNYDHPLISKLITYYKYKFIEDIADPLVRLTKKYLKQLSKHKNFSLFESNPLIISVPLSQRRLNWRGFNQSELIAKSIADFFQLRFNPGILHRTKSVTSQVMIADRDKRLQNVKGVFACSNSSLIQNQTIIIIDDICTTGATLNECARILKANGAKNVIGLVIARG